MGFGIKELLIVLVIVILLFGTKRLKNIGTDLCSAIKGFKKSISDEDALNNEPQNTKLDATSDQADIDSTASDVSKQQDK